ncbi:Uncharacterised protein [uncultured archaeon]|nr:Uncharacterised protein [uncultured archaeon]
MRIKFRKGDQRKFFDKVIESCSSPSLRGLIQFGLKINYQTLKSYYNENRTLPEDFYTDLCILGKIDVKNKKVRVIHEHWGQKLGGKH